MFLGFVALGSAIPLSTLTKNTIHAPTNADAPPAYRVYGPAGLMTNGTGTLALRDGGIPGLYSSNFTPTAPNGFLQGQTYSVLVSAVVGGTAVGDLHTFGVV